MTEATAPFTFNGYRVLCSEALAGKPRVQLLHPQIYTPKFRDEMNTWMLEFFGREPEQYAYASHDVMHGPVLFVGPDQYAKLQRGTGAL